MTHPQMKMYDKYSALQKSQGRGAKMEEQQDSVQSANIRSTCRVEAHNIPRNIHSFFTDLEQWKRAPSRAELKRYVHPRA